MIQINCLKSFFCERIIRACRGTDYKITGTDQTHAFSIVNTPASLRDLHDTAAVLTHGNGHIRTFLLQNGCGKFSHLPVSDDHTFFAFYFQTFLSKCLKCPVDHRMIACGKRHICPHFLAGSHRHAKQHFQHIVRRIMLSCRHKCSLYLCQNLIFS